MNSFPIDFALPGSVVIRAYFFGELPSLIQATKEACQRLAMPSDKVLQVSFETGKNLVQAA